MPINGAIWHQKSCCNIAKRLGKFPGNLKGKQFQKEKPAAKDKENAKNKRRKKK